MMFVITACMFLLMVWVPPAETATNDTKLCNGDSVRVTQTLTNNCFQLGTEPLPWQQAREFCHERNGWLANCPSCEDSAGMFIGSYLLASNGVKTIWTGQHVADYRLLEDYFPTPKSLAKKIVQWDISNPYGKDCVLQQLQPIKCNNGTSCSADFKNRFADCQEKHLFACFYLAEPPQYIMSPTVRGDQGVLESPYLDVQLFLSRLHVRYENSDQACSSKIPSSKAFRVKTDADRYVIPNLAGSLFNNGISMSDVNTTTLKYQLFWVARNDYPCRATQLDYLQSPAQDDHTFFSWPCQSNLQVICQVDKLVNETKAPTLMFESFMDEEIPSQGQTANNAEPERTFPKGLLREGLPLIADSIAIQQQDQPLRVYRSGVPIWQTTRRFVFLPPELILPFMPPGENDFETAILYLQEYYCQRSDQSGKALLNSNRIFVNVEGIEAFSLHVPFLVDRQTLTAFWDTYLLLLRDQYSELVVSNREGNDLSILSFVTWFNQMLGNFRQGGYKIEPLTLIPGSKDSTLVFYLYAYFGQPRRKKREAEKLLEVENSLSQLFNKTMSPFPGYLVESMELKSIEFCFAKSIYDPVTNSRYQLPNSAWQYVWTSYETCAQDGGPLVTVRCGGNKRLGLAWDPLIVNPKCNYTSPGGGDITPITLTLQKLSQKSVTEGNVTDTLVTTNDLASQLDEETVNAQDINYVADIVQRSSGLPTLTPEAAQDLLDAVATIAEVKPPVLIESNEIGGATNRILLSLDSVGQLIELKNTTSVRIVSGPIGLEVWDLTEEYKDSPVVGVSVKSETADTTNLQVSDMVTMYSTDLDYGATDMAVFLPKDYMEMILTNSSSSTADIRMSMNVYTDTVLYEDALEERQNVSLNSKVIALQLLVNGQAVTDLGQYNVTAVFQPNRDVPPDDRSNSSICVYWDFNARDGRGGWKSDGCSYSRSVSGRDVCQCNHLTNFAVLLSFYEQDTLDNEHREALSIISIIGLSLSIVGLSISMLSFLLIKKLRQGRPQQTLFQLCLSLLLSWIVFLAGIDKTGNHAGCIAVAAILHYLVMVSFMWMLMEGILQYLLFVKVMNTYFTRYMTKTSIPAWGLPLLPVIIVFAIDPELYRGGEHYCWISLDAFYYAFALPVGLIVLTNIVIFILVMINLFKRKNLGKSAASSGPSNTVVNIRASFISFMVLGLAWTFGFLAIEDARLVFQYLFCILATIQGFLIFVLMTARDKTVRKYWKDLLCRRCTHKKDHSSYTWGNKGKGKGGPDVPRSGNEKRGSLPTATSMISASDDSSGGQVVREMQPLDKEFVDPRYLELDVSNRDYEEPVSVNDASQKDREQEDLYEQVHT